MNKSILLIISLLTSWIQPGIVQEPFFTFEKIEDDDALETSDQEQGSYILRIRFPSTIKVPALCGFYKGYRLDFTNDLCIIKESRHCSSFSMIITEDVTIHWNDHTIDYLEQIPSKKCRMFYLSKNIQKDGLIEWKVEEEKKDDIPPILPKAAIILLFNPDYVNSIEPQSSQKKSLHEGVFSLPLIEIKKDISQKELDDICKASWCAAIDIRGIHRRTDVEKKNDALRLITFTRPLKAKV